MHFEDTQTLTRGLNMRAFPLLLEESVSLNVEYRFKQLQLSSNSPLVFCFSLAL